MDEQHVEELLAQLDESDINYIDEFVTRHTEMAKYGSPLMPSYSLYQLKVRLLKWEQLCRNLEAGHSIATYDYTNLLDVRCNIQKAIIEGPESFGQKLTAHLHEFDEMFTLYTLPSKKSLRPFYCTVEEAFWHKRVPINIPSEEDRADYVRQGLI